MTPYETFCLWTGLKAHFSHKNYDFFKYRGKTTNNQNHDVFMARPDKHVYVKLVQTIPEADMLDYFVSNLFFNSALTAYQMLDRERDKVHTAWRSKIESFNYKFPQELKASIESAHGDKAELLTWNGKRQPVLLSRFRSGRLGAISLIVIDSALDEKIFALWDQTGRDVVLWPMQGTQLKKLRPFVVPKVNFPQCKKVVMEMLSDNSLTSGE